MLNTLIVAPKWTNQRAGNPPDQQGMWILPNNHIAWAGHAGGYPLIPHAGAGRG